MFERGRIRLSTSPLHTVRALDLDIPKGRLVAVTGVSGSGKTTLILESLIPALRARIDGAPLPAHVRDAEAPGIGRVNLIDATPIGLNVRSTVATYSGVLDDLRRLFAAAGGVQAVRVEGKTRYALPEDAEDLLLGAGEDDRLRLLGPHDPYLDLRDRAVILEESGRQRIVWRTVGNPGVILRGGRVAGVWTARARGERLDVLFAPFEPGVRARFGELAALAEEYAAFRALRLEDCRVEEDVTGS